MTVVSEKVIKIRKQSYEDVRKSKKMRKWDFWEKSTQNSIWETKNILGKGKQTEIMYIHFHFGHQKPDAKYRWSTSRLETSINEATIHLRRECWRTHAQRQTWVLWCHVQHFFLFIYFCKRIKVIIVYILFAR